MGLKGGVSSLGVEGRNYGRGCWNNENSSEQICSTNIWGGHFAPYAQREQNSHREQNSPPKWLLCTRCVGIQVCITYMLWYVPVVDSCSQFCLIVHLHRVAFFFLCFAATQLAGLVHQKRLQVVCNNKEARKRLAKWHSRNSYHMFACIVICACNRHALDFKMFLLIFFVITKELLRA